MILPSLLLLFWTFVAEDLAPGVGGAKGVVLAAVVVWDVLGVVVCTDVFFFFWIVVAEVGTLAPGVDPAKGVFWQQQL